MRIVGLDPGTASTGFAVIEHGGDRSKILKTIVISTPPELDIQHRIYQIFGTVEGYIKVFRPKLIAIEDFTFQGRTITHDAQGVNRVIGALYLLLDYAPISMLMASDWKHAITGLRCPKSGFRTPGESKKHLDLAVRRAVSLRTCYVFAGEKQHVIDAAGVALVAGDRWGLEK